MMPKKTIIYILPHYDDEIFVIPKIYHDLENFHSVKFFFLMKSGQRKNESLRFFQSLGVKADSIFSPGDTLGVQDSKVHLNLDSLYSEISTHLDQLFCIDEIITTAYEGGHQDHDASALLARALAIKYKSKVKEFYLYHGHGTIGRSYKVASPVNTHTITKFSYTIMHYVALMRALFIYKSQFKSMLGLWPFLFTKALFYPLTLNVLEKEHLTVFAHESSPLYERWKRATHEEFQSVMRKNVKFKNLIRDTKL